MWKARDTRLDRLVAIKKLKGVHTARFQQEARAIAALNHPHICQIFDIGPDYLVLEFLEGAPLAGPLHPEQALPLALQIARAPEGGAKLLDFGLAKPAANSDAAVTQTLEGVVMGARKQYPRQVPPHSFGAVVS